MLQNVHFFKTDFPHVLMVAFSLKKLGCYSNKDIFSLEFGRPSVVLNGVSDLVQTLCHLYYLIPMSFLSQTLV